MSPIKSHKKKTGSSFLLRKEIARRRLYHYHKAESHQDKKQQPLDTITRHQRRRKADGENEHDDPAQKRTKQGLRFHNQRAYFCQITLLILLNTTSLNGPRLEYHNDFERRIGVTHSTVAKSITINNFLFGTIKQQGSFLLQLSQLEAMEEEVVDVLRFLHQKGISFPISEKVIEFVRPSETSQPEVQFKINQKAAWASDRESETWQADEISEVIMRLRMEPLEPIFLDLAGQSILARILGRTKDAHIADLHTCYITPMTMELASRIAHVRIAGKQATQTFDDLEYFFGKPMPVPDPSCSADEIYQSFREHRAELCSSYTGLSKEFSDALQINSPLKFAELMVAKATSVFYLGGPDEKVWREVIKKVYNFAFLSRDPNFKPEGWPKDKL
ncbi:hypothetical protein M426DRAFT_12586 [Hypoxylon sp. CI-4A]|nr:hypothetical protein M426DRAFT_12586 [Hypoxylon sp. CI-4A]